jgi:hypothetical protein
VRDQLQEALSLLETEITWWQDAARHCEVIAAKLNEKEQAECMLMCAVYRERTETLKAALQRLSAPFFRRPDGQQVLRDSA